LQANTTNLLECIIQQELSKQKENVNVIEATEKNILEKLDKKSENVSYAENIFIQTNRTILMQLL
jgi:hypothetical protein